jgi:EAL and modified HD-GYP domain-containing signal transduction protein
MSEVVTQSLESAHRRVCLARQPIFDRGLRLIGYELLFRDPPRTAADIVDQAAATSSVVLNALTEIGLRRVVGPHTAWINVSREFLLGGLVRTLPAERVGLEILEDQEIDEELVAAVQALHADGYRFALDDFSYRPEAEPLIDLVDVVKLDLIALGRDGFTEHVERLRHRGVTLLAEKVETHDDHRFCAEQGCTRFQGYFYRRPELLSGRRIEASRMSLLEILGALQNPALELEEVERLVSRDIGLSLRLLRYINSAHFHLRSDITSIGQALALLGLKQLRRWATLSAFAGVDDKPAELTVTALVRARFCELAAAHRPGLDSASLFTVGLFSVIDALLDTPIDEVLASLPFSEEMSQALTARQGRMGEILATAIAMENGTLTCAPPGLGDAPAIYLDALQWADDAAGQLFRTVALSA